MTTKNFILVKILKNKNGEILLAGTDRVTQEYAMFSVQNSLANGCTVSQKFSKRTNTFVITIELESKHMHL